jgi:negative regulator of flagellin synthesis FlgM
MKITETGNPARGIVQQQISKNKLNRESAKQAESRGGSGEQVTFSQRAQDIQQVEKAINKLSDIREDKVAQLKSQIEAGTYSVDGEEIATKLIAESILDILA